MAVVDGLGNAIVVPDWFGNTGPTFGGSGKVLNKRAAVMAGTVGKALSDKTSKKFNKKMRKLATSNIFTGRPQFGSDLDKSMCSTSARASIGMMARDSSMPPELRDIATKQLDACSAGKSATVTKSAKKIDKERRARLLDQALNGDLQARVRAQDALFGKLGG